MIPVDFSHSAKLVIDIYPYYYGYSTEIISIYYGFSRCNCKFHSMDFTFFPSVRVCVCMCVCVSTFSYNLVAELRNESGNEFPVFAATSEFLHLGYPEK